MPLRLKKLELQGYKTFAAKSDFIFGAGVSAIVGPNGSGKSNIVDGIRWVLGEQSFGLLRGKKTEDMIFAGSEQRPRAGMAQATLTFDNSDGWLPIEFSEVSISRRAYRDGGNEYLLNNQRVRLRDLEDLLGKVGMAERTYTVIGQGLIDTALSLKAEERRALFEEAAGIGPYRNKRDDALRKLEATQRNLDRVLDILAEIKPRLKSLERQAQRARDFNLVKTDLDAMLKIWYGYHWHRALHDLEQARAQAEHTASHLSQAQATQSDIDRRFADLRGRLSARRQQLHQWRQTADRLRRDSEALERELAVSDERLRALAEQREQLLAEIPTLEAQLAEQTALVEQRRADGERLREELRHAQSQASAAQTALQKREHDRAQLRQREAEARRQVNALAQQRHEQRARLAQWHTRRDQLAATLAEQQATLAQQQAAEAAARAKVAQASAQLETAQQERARIEALSATQTYAVRQAEADRQAVAERVAEQKAHLERLRARHDVLEQARADLTGFGEGVKTLISRSFPNRGLLSEAVRVPPEYETAISAALGSYLDALLVDAPESAESAASLLQQAAGRAALLPLSVTAPPAFTAPAEADVVGVAADLVACDPALRPAIQAVLGQTLVVRTRAAARRVLTQLNPPPALAVTLDGEAHWAHGPMIVGRDKAATTLQQARERRDLSGELTAQTDHLRQLEADLNAATQAVTTARDALNQLQISLQNAAQAERRQTVARDALALEAERTAHEVQLRAERLAALQRESAQIAGHSESTQARLAELETALAAAEVTAQTAQNELNAFSTSEAQAELNRWQTAVAVAQRAVQDAQARLAETDRARQAAADRLQSRRSRLAQLAHEAETITANTARARDQRAALANQLRDLQATIEPAESQLAALEREQTALETSDAASRAQLHSAERANAAAQLEAARKNEELTNLRRRIEEDFGLVEFDYSDTSITAPTPLPMYAVVERLDKVAVLPDDLEEHLNRKRGQLRRLGAVNPDAEREFKEVSERHDFLTAQVADLQTAQAQLREIIAEMDVLMERDFRKTFDAVAREFKETFARLFGGGTAKLTLTDPDHLTTSGVDIQCKLPGKRPQTLAMLSGGERSLTACALIFALLRVAPTPFCVLDEVDAMLDEANVGRYRDMLADLAQTTQFIVVTHNRNTVQVAETVYGITMGPDSASQVISLKLDGQKVEHAPADKFAALGSGQRQ